MATDLFKGGAPPILSPDGCNYKEWKKLVKRWTKFVKAEDSKIATIVSVKSLSGEAQSIALSIEDDELEKVSGLQTLFSELDKLYEKDAETQGYEIWKDFIAFKRGEKTILEYCAEYRRLRREAVKYDINISKCVFAYLLLDNCNITEDQKMLVLTAAI